MDSELAQILAALPNPQLARGVETPSVEYLRQSLDQAVEPFVKYWATNGPPHDKYTVADNKVPVIGGEIVARCITPVGPSDARFPALVWFHGGGWMVGGLTMDDNYLRWLSVELQLVIINVDYRMVPEHPFPGPFEDCYASVKWVAERADSLGISLAKGFIVGGSSAGGNIAAVVALYARDDPFFTSKPLSGHWLREPCVVHPDAWPDNLKPERRSWELFKDSPFMSSQSAMKSITAYINGAPITDLRMSPLLAPSHAGLPPAFIQVLGHDPIRDDGVAWERVLRESGTRTKLVQHDGSPHGAMYSFPSVKVCVEEQEDAREGLRWLLSLSKEDQKSQ